jgi:hypothetical protein
VSDVLQHCIFALLGGDLLASQVATFLFCVAGCLNGRCVSLNGIGRAAPGPALDKHKMKRVFRFVCNPRIDPLVISRAIVRILCGGQERLIIATDWTELGRISILTSGIVAFGRAIPFYFTVINKDEERQKVAERAHMRVVADLLTGVNAIHTFDRGFDDGPFLQFLLDLPILFVCRVAGDLGFRKVGTSKWQKTGKVDRRGRAYDYGVVEFIQEHCVKLRLVAIHDFDQADPWFLVTNLWDAPRKEIIRIYGFRFRVEEYFRDLKDLRGGFQLRDRKATEPARLARLLAVAAIAYLLVTAAGFFAEQDKMHRSLQVNSRKRRELALWRVGLIFLQRMQIAADQLIQAVHDMPKWIGEYTRARLC